MCRKSSNRIELVGAPALCLAVAAVLRSKDQLLLRRIVIAVGPAVIASLAQQHQLFGGQLGSLLGGVKVWPVFIELIAAVLCRVGSALGIEIDALGVAQPGRKPLGRRERLAHFVGIVAPDSAPRLELV